MDLLDDTKQSSVHLLPCSIDFDGPLDVNSFFRIEKKNKAEYRSAFRGRELIGKDFNLPHDILGINVVQGATASKTEITWDCEGEFKRIVIWQHDLAPELSQLQDKVDWFAVAEKVRSLILNILNMY